MRARALLILSTMFLVNSGSMAATSAESVELWPQIEPYHTDYLKVSDIHEIYYELSGNSVGKPVFALHGGPGGSDAG